MNNENLRTFILPFGKHKGKPLNEIPRSYLEWCLENFTNMYPTTREKIDSYLDLSVLPDRDAK